MSAEMKSTPVERLAAIERQVSQLARQIEERSRGAQIVQAQRVKLAMTHPQSYSATDPNYPSQVDGKGCRLPIVFRDVVYDEAVGVDPVTLVSRSASPQSWAYSPFGWIPRLIDLEVSWQTGYEQGGMWVVSYAPELEVEFVDNVSAGNSGTVKIVNHGDADDQEFEAWLDHMAGSNNATIGQQAIVKLRQGRKLWAVSNKEC